MNDPVQLSLPFKRGRGRPRKKTWKEVIAMLNLHAKIIEQYCDQGRTAKQLGEEHGYSSEGIKLILRKYKIQKTESAQEVRRAVQREAWLAHTKRLKEERVRELYGISLDEFETFVKRFHNIAISPLKCYMEQRRNIKQSKTSNNEFNISFDAWWKLWEIHWQNRGRKKNSLVMVRRDITKPFDIDNVILVAFDNVTKADREALRVEDYRDWDRK